MIEFLSMRILAYSSYYKPYISGMTVYLERVLNHLRTKSNITLLTFKHLETLPGKETLKRVQDDPQSQKLRRATQSTISLERMPYWFRLSKGFISPQSLVYFWKGARKNDAVLINIPNGEAFFLALFAKLFKKKLVSIYQCDVDLGDGLINKTILFILNLSVNLQLWMSDYIVAFPDYVQHRSFYKKYKHKIVETLPPVETVKADSLFLKRSLAQKGVTKRIGFVGRIASEKGLEYIVEAMKIIDNPLYELVIAGPGRYETVGEEIYYDNIVTTLENSSVHYRIYASPSDKELAALYETFDVLVLPSYKKTEAFGMVQAEAMLHGAQVISSHLPGIRLPVKLTGFGRTFEAKNSEKLAEALVEVLSKKTDRAAIVKKAKTIFDANTVYKHFDELFFGDQ